MIAKSEDRESNFVWQETYIFFRIPDFCCFVNSNACKFVSITIPRDMSDALRSWMMIVLLPECGKVRELDKTRHDHGGMIHGQ